MLKDRVYRDVNETYDVIIGTSIQKDSLVDDALVYKIRNKETGVIEAETTVLAKALVMCDLFLDELMSLDTVKENLRLNEDPETALPH